MKTIPSALAGHLAGRVTTCACCWIVTRRDGVNLGFTDHDRTLTVESVVCQPENGLGATAMTGGPGLATGGGEVEGSLSGPALASADLDAGLWDGAEVRVYLVNWNASDEPLLMRRAHIGEVVRTGDAFRAELRGLAHLLEARRGRVFSRTCDADVGDSRCGIDLSLAPYRGDASVIACPDLSTLTVSGLESFSDGWFTGGRFSVTSGAQSGFASEIAMHSTQDGNARIALWQPLVTALEAGTSVTLTAGCDKGFATCQAKFANGLNFRGFPHMPGTDFVLSYPTRNTVENDGGALVS